jgi:hypothetical protein
MPLRKITLASVMATVLSGAVVPLATLPQQQQKQNNIAPKKSCNPDACIKMVRQKGSTFATAATWCAKNNNGC